MAQYDGSIRIGTGIDKKGFEAGSKDLEKEARRMTESIADTLGEGAKIALQKQTDAFVKLNQRYADQVQKVKDLGSELHDLQRTQVETPIFKETSKDLSAAEKELDRFYGNLRKIEKARGYISSDEIKKEEAEVSKLTEKVRELAKIRNRSPRDSDEYKKASNEVSKYQKLLDSATKKLKEHKSANEKIKNSTIYKNAIAQIDIYEEKVSELQNELKELKQSGEAYQPADTSKVQQKLADAEQKQMQMYTALQTAADSLSQKTNERVAKEDSVREKIAEEAAEEERLDQIRVNAVATNDQIIAKVERLKQLEQEIADLKKVNKTEGYADYDNRIKEASRLRQDIREYNNELTKTPEKFENMRKSANKAFNAVANGTKKSSGLLSTFASRFKGLALSLLIFNQISKAFNAMVAGMKRGFENLSGYSNSYASSVQSMKNAMSTLGNQFAAAFAPIVQMVIPWLTSLINAISRAVTYIAQFIAVLSGSGTFTRAKKVQDAYNKSLGGTAAAAKKAFGALARFDDLDVLQKKDDTSGGGAGGGAGASDLFEEVPVDPKLQELLEIILEKAKQLKEIFMKGFWDGLGDWEYRLNSIKDSISSIKQSLIDIWTDPSVLSSGDRWIESVAYLLGSISGSIASVGLTIGANLLGGISRYLSGNKDRIKEYLISMFDIWGDINYLISDFFQSFAYIFETFADENGQRLTENIIGIFSNAFIGLNEILSELIFDILNAFIQPFVDNQDAFREAIDGFLGVLADVLETIKQGIDNTFDKLREVYDEYFKPFFDSVAEGLSYLVGRFLEFWNSGVQPILDSLAEKFAIVWVEHIQPALDGFIEMLGMLIELLKIFWEETLAPLIDWVIENILPVILPILDGIVDGFFVLLSGISDVVSGIINVIKGIITFLVGIFTRDWEKAWDGAKKIFNGFKEIVDSIIGTIKDIIQSFIDWVMRMVEEAINALKSIGGAAGGGSAVVGGMAALPTRSERSISAIASYNLDKIPALASGAVIRGGNPFMAILGDQRAGQTNVEAPASLIKDMVVQGIAESGIGNTSGNINADMTLDGESFARLFVPYVIDEMKRQGLAVEVLGVT